MKGHNIKILGAAVLRVTLPEMNKDTGKEVFARCNIFEKGFSDWLGIIIGARALDCVERGGLGFRTTANAHVFDKFGLNMQRMETIQVGAQRPDEAYRMEVVEGEGPTCTNFPKYSALDEHVMEDLQ